jgi:hypothetical protein
MTARLRMRLLLGSTNGTSVRHLKSLLLLNNDVEVVDPGWLKEMVTCLAYPNAGIVGARLLYPDGRLQHVGVIVGLGGVAGHWYCRQPASHPGPMGRLMVRQTLSAVTGACMLISKDCRPTSRASFANKRRYAPNTGLSPMLIARSILGMGVIRAIPVSQIWSNCPKHGRCRLIPGCVERSPNLGDPAIGADGG